MYVLHNHRMQIHNGQGARSGPIARVTWAQRATILARLRPAPACRPRPSKHGADQRYATQRTHAACNTKMGIYHVLAAPHDIGDQTWVVFWDGWSRGGTGRPFRTSVAGFTGKREKWLRSDGGARRVLGMPKLCPRVTN